MNRILAAAVLVLPIALGGCADLGKISPALQTACDDALAIANIAGLIPGVGVIVPYITAGCATAEGIAKLAADPTSTAWLGQLVGMIKGLAAAVGMKL